MKQSIQLRLGQQLTMTPQLQQAIRLLQLSTVELQTEIQDVLDANIMLENAEEAERVNGESGGDSAGNERDREEAQREQESQAERELAPDSSSMPDDLPVDSQWSDVFDSYVPTSSRGSDDGSDYDIFAQQSRPETLHEHLEWQLNLTHMSERDQTTASAIIDSIDPNGYLSIGLEELVATLSDEETGPDEVKAVLHLIQTFDPPGVGARDLRECLLLQLRQIPTTIPYRKTAIAVCEHFFDKLGKNDLDTVRKQLNLSAGDMSEVIALIRTLQPYPGALVSDRQPEYIVPDVIVRKKETAWQVELNPETTPKLRVNPSYARLIRRADQSADNTCMKNHMQEARWFIKSLASRNDTVLRVATKIVDMQRDFLEHGEESMKPMVLRDIAEALDLHESTISRVTTQKYMHTPRGTFEFKYFFSSHLNTASGGECSSTAIRALIRKLVSAENPSKALSDNKIANILADQGINVARRTIAKYREAMGIPPSNERKRLE